MSEKVDALFAGDPPAAPEPAEPKLKTIRGMLWVGIPLVVLGVPCWTSVPGAVLTLWAWLATDAEIPRIEAGTYSKEDAQRLMRLRRRASQALILCVISLVIQIFLLNTHFYEWLWGGAAEAIHSLRSMLAV